MRILTIVPSRSRPHQAVELAEAYYGTTALDTTDLLFAVDDDDPTLPEYERQLKASFIPYVVAPRMRMGPTLNHWAKRNARRAGVIGFMGDDHRPRTPKWDRSVAAELDLGPGVAYGDDLVHGPNLPTAAFQSVEIVKALGYFSPPGLTHMYLDNYWLMLGRHTRLCYLGGVVFEHLHPLVGKADWSEQYEEVNGFMGPDQAEFQRYVTEDWPAEVEKLRKAGLYDGSPVV